MVGTPHRGSPEIANKFLLRAPNSDVTHIPLCLVRGWSCGEWPVTLQALPPSVGLFGAPGWEMGTQSMDPKPQRALGLVSGPLVWNGRGLGGKPWVQPAVTAFVES